MADVFAIVNQKGGVGKTTTTLNLGAYLSAQGKRVLVIDLDPQANATSGFGVDHRAVEKGIYDVLIGEARLVEVLVDTPHVGLRLAPANQNLAGASIELVSRPHREFLLYQSLQETLQDFDFVLVDCPPSLGLLTLNGLVAAERVIIPVQAEYYALEGLGQLLHTIELVRDNLRPELRVFGALITMYDGRTRLSKDVMTELIKHFPKEIFQAVIPRSVRLAEAPSFGKTILAYDPESRGARAYEQLTHEFLSRVVGGEPTTV